MQSRMKWWMVIGLAAGLLLAAGCGREEKGRETGGGAVRTGVPAMPVENHGGSGMENAVASGRDLTTMRDMREELLGQEMAEPKAVSVDPAKVQDAGGTMTARAGNGGAALFQQHCAVCHPGGKNIINPEKPLDRKALTANGITTPEDIVALTRNPGPGMTPFSPQVLPDKEARQIAEYILATF